MRSLLAAAALALLAPPAAARPWDDRALGPDRRAALMLGAMTEGEELSLVHGVLGAPWGGKPKPPDAIGSAGYVPGVPRLGLPALQETDAELGVTDPGNVRPGDTATAMPSNLALGATFDPDLARRQGAAVAAEARAKGFDVLLGGAANLIRDPRGGRNFEFFSEDPLLTGVMAGAAVAGAQGGRMLTTVKHYAFNDQETDRVVLDARVARAAARESDLLAFEIAIGRGAPGAVMCGYNGVDGAYACQNPWLLRDVLKRGWRYPGFVLSDWGAVHATVASALAGLDQESAEQLDTENFFGAPFAAAVRDGRVPRARLDDMARRILRSAFAAGIVDEPPRPGPVDLAPAEAVAQDVAERGAVLLVNDGLLPLPRSLRRIAVIGGHADRGVLAGGGSSQVNPTGGLAASEPSPDRRKGEQGFDPSSPLDAVRAASGGAEVVWADGRDVAAAARLAAGADAALVFATQWMTETADAPDLRLPSGQDALIEAVAAANPRTAVVLETGGPVLMPWRTGVAAVLEAWYLGQRGGPAIARLLFGDAVPAGRLPFTWPRDAGQLPRAAVPGDPDAAPTGPVGRGGHYGRTFAVDYAEGAEVGYKWFAARGEAPLFPFGFGLSTTRFALGPVSAAAAAGRITAEVSVRNAGARAGTAVPQLYLSGPGFGPRLVGWARLDLAPGQEGRASIEVDSRLAARWDEAAGRWRIAPGTYRAAAGFDAASAAEAAEVTLPGGELPP